MEDKIKDLFATILKVKPSEVNDAASPGSLTNWDSLQHLFLVSGFEEEFGIEIEPEEAVDMYKDFGAFKRIVLRKLPGGV
ncbi:MAG: phosphopantetheine-binding protein [Deltaproteobacteria bacterium]|mgnify:CR=1 FL=1|jgi:acyl carrier protein